MNHPIWKFPRSNSPHSGGRATTGVQPVDETNPANSSQRLPNLVPIQPTANETNSSIINSATIYQKLAHFGDQGRSYTFSRKWSSLHQFKEALVNTWRKWCACLSWSNSRYPGPLEDLRHTSAPSGKWGFTMVTLQNLKSRALGLDQTLADTLFALHNTNLAILFFWKYTFIFWIHRCC